ncbi:MAG: hypothetical protein EYC70_09385 [Planctomycetota bacterium]|nr:MAG: hypothetical protein EYC70_09385 [Planctomycetota bacterium]
MTSASGSKSLFPRVFLFGAGFSAGMKYPLGGELVPLVIEYLERRAARRATRKRGQRLRDRYMQPQRILRSIDLVLDKYCACDRDSLEELSVTEFFSIAHMLAQMPELVGEEGHEERELVQLSTSGGHGVAQVFDDVAAVVRTVFTERCQKNRRLPRGVRSVLEGLAPDRDAVVSFNWDEEVDYFLSMEHHSGAEVHYTYRTPWGPPAFLVLKPHGSVGWYDVAKGIGNASTYFIASGDSRVPRFQRRVLAYEEIGFPVDLEHRRAYTLVCPPVITPPTFAKQYQFLEQKLIWQDVIRACREAHEFVFLGYSLPIDDYLTRAALRAAIQSHARRRLRCLVVNKHLSPELLANYRSVLGPGMDEQRNFLACDFTRAGADLREAIATRLAAAHV